MTTRLWIVDDSDISSEVVRRVLEAAPDLRVVGRSAGVDELLRSGTWRAADVLILDLWMPGKTGLGAIRSLSTERPVVVVSDVEASSPLAVEALGQGAIAVVCKRELGSTDGERRLRATVRAAQRRATVGGPVVAIVGSTGAMGALEKLIPAIAGSGASVLIVQHLPQGREKSFAEWLGTLGLPAREAKTGDSLEVDQALVATARGHLRVDGPRRVTVRDEPPVEGHRPSGTELLRSAAPLESRLIAVVLSGMGRDGADGVAEIMKRGGACVVQAPADCAVPSMPEAALAVSPRVRAVPLRDLGAAVRRLIERMNARE